MDALIKSVCLRAVGLLLLTTSTSCVSTDHDAAPFPNQHLPAIVQGRLFDDKSGKPIADAIVEWSTGDRKQTGSTDSNGVFSFSIPVGDGDDADKHYRKGAGEVLLSTTANLYRTERRRVEIRPEQTTKVKIGLTSKPQEEIGVVRGTLRDADTGRGIPYAVVSILGAGGGLSTATGSDGGFKLERVGFNPTLRIEVTTPTPPCISRVERPLVVDRSVVQMDVAVAILKIPLVHCP